MYSILIVDDEPDVRVLMEQKFRRQLRDEKFTLQFAGDGVEALEVLSSDDNIAMVLTDINMPRMDGLTLLDEIQKLTDSHLKTVVVSAYGDIANIRTAMNRGAFDFVTKPIDFGDLEMTIQKTLDEIHRLREALQAQTQLSSLQYDLSTAARIQQKIIPKIFPPFPDKKQIDIYASMDAARDVGGDFYDYFFIDNERLAFLIGDVSGKGVPAAIYMAICRTMMRAVASQVADPGECLRRVNKMLIPDSDLTTFVTVFYGVLNIRTGSVKYCNGGHDLPIVLRADGSTDTLEDTQGLLLGKFEPIDFETERVNLNKGDIMVLTTDGVAEAMNREQDFYTTEKLEETLKEIGGGKTPKEVTEGIIASVKGFVNGYEQSDDITMLLVQYKG
ncbi:MAG: SpoIIE family protein phosphatase [Rhodothermaceae bacterium]|nr:SpoIIE family protein phosphatase [Rhodothermaceae bacterium]